MRALGIPENSLNWLVAATVLAWSVAPPAVEHSHEGGFDPTHQHGRAAGIESAHCSHHTHEAEHAHSPAVLTEAAFGGVSHLHFQWLGFRVTLPGDSSPAKKGEDRNASKPLFIQAGRTPLSQFHLGMELDKPLAQGCLDALAMDAEAICPAVTRLRLPIMPHPLCDRARHERSGVLLA